MRTGDRVILVDDPLKYGYGLLEDVLRDGRVTVKWEGGDLRPYWPHQIELAAIWERGRS